MGEEYGPRNHGQVEEAEEEDEEEEEEEEAAAAAAAAVVDEASERNSSSSLASLWAEAVLYWADVVVDDGADATGVDGADAVVLSLARLPRRLWYTGALRTAMICSPASTCTTGVPCARSLFNGGSLDDDEAGAALSPSGTNSSAVALSDEEEEEDEEDEEEEEAPRLRLGLRVPRVLSRVAVRAAAAAAVWRACGL